MSVSFLLVVVCLFAAMALALYRETPQALPARAGLLRDARGDDADMKIADGSFRGHTAEDPAEAVARQFLRQKQSGNIEKARALGSTFAGMLLSLASPQESAHDRSMLEAHHRLLLCSYIVNRVIADYAPDSLLAQTSLQVFYKDIEEQSDALYRQINDLAAFSLYMLWERSGSSDEQEIGRIYARLCNREGDSTVEDACNALYQQFHAACVAEIQKADYSSIER